MYKTRVDANVERTASGGCFVLIGCGLHLAWSFARLRSSLDVDEHFTFLAFYIGIVLGAALGAFLVNRIGRKNNTYISAAAIFLSGVCFVIPQPAFIGIGRFIAGFAFGTSYLTQIILISEITTKFSRGKFLIYTNFSVYVGYFCFYCFYDFYSSFWELIIGVMCLVYGVLSSVFTYNMRESPYFLIMTGHDEAAMSSLMYLRGASVVTYSVTEEFNEIKSRLSEESSNRRLSLIDGVLGDNKRAMLLAALLKVVQAISFNPFIMTLHLLIASFMMQYATGRFLWFFVILAASRLLGSIMAMIFVDKIGRRSQLLASGCGAATGLLIVDLVFANVDLIPVNTVFTVSFVLILLVEFFLGFGYGSVPEVVLGETMSTHAKPFAIFLMVAISTIVNGAFYYVYALLAPYIDQTYILGVFGFAAVCLTLSSLLVYLLLPETNQKSFREIKQLFNGR